MVQRNTMKTRYGIHMSICVVFLAFSLLNLISNIIILKMYSHARSKINVTVECAEEKKNVRSTVVSQQVMLYEIDDMQLYASNVCEEYNAQVKANHIYIIEEHTKERISCNTNKDLYTLPTTHVYKYQVVLVRKRQVLSNIKN